MDTLGSIATSARSIQNLRHTHLSLGAQPIENDDSFKELKAGSSKLFVFYREFFHLVPCRNLIYFSKEY